jgi:hypothetical protein
MDLKILIQCIETYIVTSGESYNLQVWNRIPNSSSILIQHDDGNAIRSNDIRFVVVKIDMKSNKIESDTAIILSGVKCEPVDFSFDASAIFLIIFFHCQKRELLCPIKLIIHLYSFSFNDDAPLAQSSSHCHVLDE